MKEISTAVNFIEAEMAIKILELNQRLEKNLKTLSHGVDIALGKNCAFSYNRIEGIKKDFGIANK